MLNTEHGNTGSKTNFRSAAALRLVMHLADHDLTTSQWGARIQKHWWVRLMGKGLVFKALQPDGPLIFMSLGAQTWCGCGWVLRQVGELDEKPLFSLVPENKEFWRNLVFVFGHQSGPGRQ